jgi:prophage regulatory protein
MSSNQIFRLPDVIAATGLSRSSIYAAIRSGTFPERIALGQRAVGWLSKDIEVWIEGRKKISRRDRG